MELVHNAHDRFFKDAFSNLKVAQEFFEEHLPKSVQQYLNFNTLELQPGSYLDHALKQTASDVLYQVEYLNQEGFSYLYVLTEHQSSVDMRMPFRLWRYIISIWNEYFKKHGGNKLPLVIPIVFYNGKKVYNGPREIQAMIEAPQLLIDECLFQPFRLIDVQTIPDEIIRQKYWSGLMEYVMKCTQAKEALNCAELLIELLNRICEGEGIDYGTVALKYFLTQTETTNSVKLIKILENGLTGEDSLMGTVAQYLREQGVQQGLEQGVQQGELNVLLNLIKFKFKEVPEAYMEKIVRADTKTLNQWAINVINAQLLDQVFN